MPPSPETQMSEREPPLLKGGDEDDGGGMASSVDAFHFLLLILVPLSLQFPTRLNDALNLNSASHFHPISAPPLLGVS